MKIGVVIAAGGSSTRMQKGVNKLLMPLQGVPVILMTINAFIILPEISQLVIVGSEAIKRQIEALVAKNSMEKVLVVTGGESRRKSVYQGIKALDKNTDIVLIHDGARPFVKEADIRKCIHETITKKACCLGVKSKDTIKMADKSLKVEYTPDRNTLYQIQTPQGFTYEIACSIHEMAEKENDEAVDDCILAEKAGYPVYIVEGSYDNIKITTADDLKMADYLLCNRQYT